ncbi:MAG: response regulator, partial [Bacteroidota bacterium]
QRLETNARIEKRASIQSKKPSVVLVEDHPEMREFVSKILSKDYEVISAPSAEEGWDLILEHIPDLIITDLMLPGMNGDDLCKEIKTNIATDHLPVIALSAKHSTQARVELYSHGADNYVTKPFETEELLGIANSLIDQRRKLRERFSTLKEQNRSSAGMARIDDIIEREIENSDYGPRDLEKEIGLNRNQLQKKIKGITGYTPVEYFRVFRLEKARLLIRNGQTNVSEAAFQTGFNQIAYFSSSYKKYFGVSPSEDLPVLE